MARENMKTKYQVYVAAALMEYYCSKVSKPITTEAVSSNPTQMGCAQYNIKILEHILIEKNILNIYFLSTLTAI
jgi:hypothetical protein